MMAAASHITREPTEEHIAAWRRKIERLGGAAAGICRPRELTLVVGEGTRLTHTCGCGGDSLAAVPFEGRHGQPIRATVCAVCDAATEFPRLRS